jgi:hypothetical protein
MRSFERALRSPFWRHIPSQNDTVRRQLSASTLRFARSENKLSHAQGVQLLLFVSFLRTKSGATGRELMKSVQSTLFVFGLLIVPTLGQTPQRIAEIKEKVVGKWWSGDQKLYIDFLPDGGCSKGSLFVSPDGSWHVEEGRLKTFEQGDVVVCDTGNPINEYLTLVAPNKMNLDHGWIDEVPTKFYRGLQNVPKIRTTITISEAKRLLARQINATTVQNTLLTCRACFDPNDKDENDRAAVVSTYPPVMQFLLAHGYIRTSGDRQVFTAKAKRSRYYGLDGFGLRLVNFRNPTVQTATILDPRHVPIEYDFVPTALTMNVLGGVRKIKSMASFEYANEEWTVCIGCRQ